MKKAASAKPNTRLVHERLQRRWSQQDVATMIGTTRINVSRWECGVTNPGPYFRDQLCKLFEKDAENLGLIPNNRNTTQKLVTHQKINEDVMKISHTDSGLVSVTVQPDVNVDELSDLAEEPVPLQSPTTYSLPEAQSFPYTWKDKYILLRIRTATLISAVVLIGFLLTSTYTLIKINGVWSINSHNLTDNEKNLQRERTLEAQLFQKKGIGISDGNYIFDTYSGRTDIPFKTQAALQLRSGDTSGAINSMTRAVSSDVLDGEIQIFNENLHVLQSASPYVTVVLGLAIDNIPGDLIRARLIMQSAFLAQKEINTKGLLPHHLLLRILIANSGADNANVATIAQFIANRVNYSNPDHIIAVVGWPFSSQTTNALNIIAGVHLPMISQTASSIALSGSSSYFFRVNPSDRQQGQALGVEAVNNLHVRTILLLQDPTDPYSVSLANAFAESATALKANVLNDLSGNYFIEQTTTVEDYQQKLVDTVLSKQIDLIFIAGFDVDAIRMAHALGNLARTNPQNTQLASLKIMAGDAVATSLLLGEGNSPDAAIARDFPQDIQRLIFSAFAHPNEWTFANIPANEQPAFFTDWNRLYRKFINNDTDIPFPDDHAILTYDAFQVIVKAAEMSQYQLNGDTIRQALSPMGNESRVALQGVSGWIVFDNQGDPVNKVIVILDIEAANGRNAIVLKQLIGLLQGP